MTNNKTISFFGFVYRKSGGFIGADDRISYESISKKLIFVDKSKKNEKQLETQDEDKLKQTISDNGFFEVGNFILIERIWLIDSNIQSLLQWMAKYKRPIGLMG